LRERFGDATPEMLFVGTRGGLEAAIVPKTGLSSTFVASRPLARRVSLEVLRTLGANALGFVQALRILARFRPEVVIATGGYVTVPVVLAARVLRATGLSRVRIAVLEPNAVAGLANRLLGPLADEVWVAFAHAASSLARNAVRTGTPVRASLLLARPPHVARRSLGLDPVKTTIVVMGGSQGARRINDALAQMIVGEPLPPDWQVLHVSGPREADRARKALQDAGSPADVTVVPYLDDPGAAYAAADVVVARAGASTLAELAATGTPSILVPYPHAAGDHQSHNAEAVRAAGAARVVADADLSGARLRVELAAALEPAARVEARAAASALAVLDARAHIAERVSGLLGARVKTVAKQKDSIP
jgi:UDP-N-acetylglucosamine--N-acetylmuramyl-(pentapeptide) pyrophosphoryl-undecaprenol N-acetylglucosamine transferase